MIRKLGLAGKSGSGKDAVADYLCQRYGYFKLAVADAIRDEVEEFLTECLNYGAPESGAAFSTYREVIRAFEVAVWAKPTTPEIRVLLQWFGTEYRRSQDTNYWVKRLRERLDNNRFIVVSDVRTPAELQALHDAGGEVWFVERPGVDSVGIPNHFTEIALDGATFDRTIYNDGTLSQLEAKVDWIIGEC